MFISETEELVILFSYDIVNLACGFPSSFPHVALPFNGFFIVLLAVNAISLV